MNDTIEDAEYITEKEFYHLHSLYSSARQDVLIFLELIYDCGTCELYSKLYDHSPNTLRKLEQAIDIMKKNDIALVPIMDFDMFTYSKVDGWGDRFNGEQLSMFL